jgi:hypothetical protein
MPAVRLFSLLAKREIEPGMQRHRKKDLEKLHPTLVTCRNVLSTHDGCLYAERSDLPMAESRQKEAAGLRRNLERNGWVCYRRHHMPFLLNPLVCGLTTDNFDSGF